MRLSEDTIDKVVKWFNKLPEHDKYEVAKDDSDGLLVVGLRDKTGIQISPRQFQRIRLERCGYKKKAANGEGKRVAEPEQERQLKVGDKATVESGYSGIWFSPGETVVLCSYNREYGDFVARKSNGDEWYIHSKYLRPLPEPAQRTPSAKYSIIDIDGYTVSAEYKIKDNRIVAYPVLHTPDGKIIKPNIAEE